MSDLFLATVVIVAVIAFGVLISIGNERQRRAIDALHRAYKQWAVQDVRLKRGTARTQIEVEDLTSWLTKTTSLALGRKTTVMDYQIYDSPITTVEFIDRETNTTLIYTLESPEAVKIILKKKRRLLSRELTSNPLFKVGKKALHIELSVLNAGTMFDIELPVAWKRLTGQSTECETVWAYILN